MKYEARSLADLSLLTRNPRRHTPVQIRELKRSIEKFGQIRPIVVDENGAVLAGNGLLIALRELGREEGLVLQLADLSENDKKRLTLADNKIAALGVDDFSVVEELIAELAGELDIPGWDDSILESLTMTPVEVQQSGAAYGTMTQDDRDKAERAATRIDQANEKFEAAPPVASAPAAEINVCPTCHQRIWDK